MMKPGDCVFRLEPYAMVARDTELLTRCDHCLEQSDKRCSVCKAVAYCSRDCQKVAWSRYHKLECRCLLKNAPKVPKAYDRLFVKLLARHLGDDPGGSVWRDSAGLRRFCDLMSHEAEFRADNCRMMQFSALLQTVRWYTAGVLKRSQLPSAEIMLIMVGRMIINSLLFHDDFGVHVGGGLCLSASVLDHSCSPTARIYFQSGRVVVKCLATVDSFDALRVSYCDVMMPWKERNFWLRRFYFTCHCEICLVAERCGGEPDELKCSRVGCDGVCTFTETSINKRGRICSHCVCDLCGSPPVTRDPGLVRAWRSRFSEAFTSSEDFLCPPLILASKLLKDPKNPLHPQHRLCFPMYSSLYNDYGSRDDKLAALRIGETALLPAYERHLRACPWHLKAGQLRLQLGNLALGLEDFPRALEHLGRAEEVLSVTLEPDSSALASLREVLTRTRLNFG